MAMSLALLRIVNSSNLVFQRRDFQTTVYPGLLTFFGGRIEEGESPLEAFHREVGEETSYSPDDLRGVHALLLHHIVTLADGRNVQASLFEATVDDQPEYVYEGSGAELHSIEAALDRTDLAEIARTLIKDLGLE